MNHRVSPWVRTPPACRLPKRKHAGGVRTAWLSLPSGHRRFGNLRGFGDLAPQFLREPGHQTIQFFGVGARQRIARGTQGRRRDGSATMQDLFSNGEADVWLLLVPHERQIKIEE